MRTLAILAVCVFGLTTGADAQQHPPAQPKQPGHPMMQGMQGMGHDMMQMMGGAGPEMLLHMKEALGLSAEQVGKIEAVQRASQQAMMPHHHAAMTAHTEAAKVLEGDSPDFAKYQAKLQEAANHMILGHVEMAKAAAQARAVLTPEQRANVRFHERMMKDMHKSEGGPGGMMQRPGPGHEGMGGMMQRRRPGREQGGHRL